MAIDKTDLDFPETLTLRAIQEHIHRVCQHYGWDKNSSFARFLLLSEELGEVAKAIRKLESLSLQKNKPVTDHDTLVRDLGDELADMLNYICDIAQRYDIDLQDAYVRKMQEVLQREW